MAGTYTNRRRGRLAKCKAGIEKRITRASLYLQAATLSLRTFRETICKAARAAFDGGGRYYPATVETIGAGRYARNKHTLFHRCPLTLAARSPRSMVADGLPDRLARRTVAGIIGSGTRRGLPESGGARSEARRVGKEC